MYFISTYIQYDMKKRQQSNSKTSHFENDLGAYLPLNIAIAIFFSNLFIYLFFLIQQYRLLIIFNQLLAAKIIVEI